MSDTQVLKSLNVDIDGLCTSMIQMENALSPYQACLEKNVNGINLFQISYWKEKFSNIFFFKQNQQKKNSFSTCCDTPKY